MSDKLQTVSPQSRSSVTLLADSVSLSSTLCQSVSCPQTPPAHKKNKKLRLYATIQTGNLSKNKKGLLLLGLLSREKKT